MINSLLWGFRWSCWDWFDGWIIGKHLYSYPVGCNPFLPRPLGIAAPKIKSWSIQLARPFQGFSYLHTLPESNILPLKIGHPKIHFQVRPVSFREGTAQKNAPPKHHRPNKLDRAHMIFFRKTAASKGIYNLIQLKNPMHLLSCFYYHFDFKPFRI